MRALQVLVVLLFVSVLATPLLSNDVQAAEGRSSTATTVTYTGAAQSVELLGEWDWNTPLVMNETGGVWTVDVELAEGLYCYKFIVDGTYIFDPANPERTYCDDIENSLLRVNDPLRPHYTADLVGDELRVTFHPGASGASHNGTPEALSSAVWEAGSSSWIFDLTSLDDGKHTLHIEGADLDGNVAHDLLIPFWRGAHADFVWEDALIYMIMTDRFVNGNESNDGSLTGAAQGADWQGGDFAGVTAMIESGYFADLGVNALWLTPFNTAANGTGKAADGVHDVAAYHGYWPIEARGIDPRLGTPEELHAMMDAAHEAGLRVMMDFVVNHVHEDHEYHQNHPDWFNAGCICGQANCDWTEHRLDCQFTAYMPDVNWKNRQASEQFIADALYWIETYGLDGVRVDAVKHVENLAVANLVAQINHRFETVGTDIYLKGETAMGWSGHALEDNQAQYGSINAYMGPDGLDGQADFVLYHAVVDNVFVSGNENYQHLDYWTNRSQDQYTPGSLMVPYVGSHDVSRLTSRADTGTGDAYNQWVEDGLPGQPGDISAYHASLQAYGWLLTTPGAPLLYYGDEYGEYGGADPDNRHMYRNESEWSVNEASLYENISQLGQLRSESIALRQGSYSTRLAMPNLLVYNMTHENQTMSVVLNRGGPTQVDGFGDNDSVRFGDAVLSSGQLAVGAHSVSVIELNVESDGSSTNQTGGNETGGNETGGNTTVSGCTDPAAENYDPTATVDDNTCTYAPQPVLGCTNASADNFNPNATQDDGSCVYTPPAVQGCTNQTATNYDPNATQDDGSCVWPTEPADPCGDVQCDTCPEGWDVLPAEEGGCCPLCKDPNDSVDNQTGMQTCEGCCGETFEVPADEVCPMVSCAECESTTSTFSLQSTAVRAGLLMVVIALAASLLFTGKPPASGTEQDLEDEVEEEPPQAN